MPTYAFAYKQIPPPPAASAPVAISPISPPPPPPQIIPTLNPESASSVLLSQQLQEQEESFTSAEGKELQRIAAEKFKDVNGWVPRELMFRTKMCSFFYHTGKCAKGDRCNFSHTFEPGMEIPPVPPKKPEISARELRTKPCKFYFIYGRCSKGEECNFSHDPTIFLKSSENGRKEIKN